MTFLLDLDYKETRYRRGPYPKMYLFRDNTAKKG